VFNFSATHFIGGCPQLLSLVSGAIEFNGTQVAFKYKLTEN
jgi:hypothetical protein